MASPQEVHVVIDERRFIRQFASAETDEPVFFTEARRARRRFASTPNVFKQYLLSSQVFEVESVV